jgi:hypothetical protein
MSEPAVAVMERPFFLNRPSEDVGENHTWTLIQMISKLVEENRELLSRVSNLERSIGSIQMVVERLELQLTMPALQVETYPQAIDGVTWVGTDSLPHTGTPMGGGTYTVSVDTADAGSSMIVSTVDGASSADATGMIGPTGSAGVSGNDFDITNHDARPEARYSIEQVMSRIASEQMSREVDQEMMYGNYQRRGTGPRPNRLTDDEREQLARAWGRLFGTRPPR